MVRILLRADSRRAKVLSKVWPRISCQELLGKLLGNWQMECARVQNDYTTYVVFVGFRFLENPYD